MRWRLCQIRNSGRYKLNSILLCILTWLCDLDFPHPESGRNTTFLEPCGDDQWHSVESIYHDAQFMGIQKLRPIPIDNPSLMLSLLVLFFFVFPVWETLVFTALCNLEIPDVGSVVFYSFPRWIPGSHRWGSPLQDSSLPFGRVLYSTAPKPTGTSTLQTHCLKPTPVFQGPLQEGSPGRPPIRS